MKTILSGFCLFVLIRVFAAAQTAIPAPNEQSPAVQPSAEIHWLTLEQAVALSAQERRPVIIDVYTDWCGWCKKMDAATFQHPTIAKYVESKFFPVRLNAEQKDSIKIENTVYKYVPGPNGRGGVNELAGQLLDGKMSYPSLVFLDLNFNKIQVLPGYRGPQEMEPILKFFGSGAYVNMPWETFMKTFVPEVTQ